MDFFEVYDVLQWLVLAGLASVIASLVWFALSETEREGDEE